MLIKFINHYKNFASHKFSVFVAYQANFLQNLRVNDKKRKST